MLINYQGVNPPTGWVNAPSTASPRNAENLQIMNAGTKAACDGVDALFGDMASEYSASSTYAVGQYCIRNNLFYRCTVAIGTPEPWNASKWVATTVGAEFKAVNDNLVGLRTVRLVDAIVTDPRNVVVNKWSSLQTGISYMATLQDQNYTYTAIIQCAGPNHGACTIIGYTVPAPIYGKLDSGVWTWT